MSHRKKKKTKIAMPTPATRVLDIRCSVLPSQALWVLRPPSKIVVSMSEESAIGRNCDLGVCSNSSEHVIQTAHDAFVQVFVPCLAELHRFEMHRWDEFEVGWSPMRSLLLRGALGFSTALVVHDMNFMKIVGSETRFMTTPS